MLSRFYRLEWVATALSQDQEFSAVSKHVALLLVYSSLSQGDVNAMLVDQNITASAHDGTCEASCTALRPVQSAARRHDGIFSDAKRPQGVWRGEGKGASSIRCHPGGLYFQTNPSVPLRIDLTNLVDSPPARPSPAYLSFCVGGYSRQSSKLDLLRNAVLPATFAPQHPDRIASFRCLTMAPHTAPQPPLPPPRVLTLGIELEMAMFDDVTYEAVAQLLRAAGLKAEVGPYDREKPDPWRVTVDHSVASEEDLRRYRQPVTLQKYFERLGHPTLKGPIYVPAVKVPRPANDASSKRRTLPTEIISPPFEDDQGQKTAHWHRQVQIALDAVNAGPYDLETNRTTGFHVHIGAGLQPDQVFTVDEVKKIAALYLAYEKRIDKLHPEHRLDDWFARSQVVHSAFSDIERPGALILAIGSMEELVRSMCPPDVTSPIPEIPDEEQSVSGDSDSEQPTKYYKLNLVGLLDQHRTIEFRQHQGTTIPIVVQRWADFTLAFVRKALTISEEELVELSVDDNASIFDDPLLRRAFYGAEADQ